jgi:hypothetical protein
MRFESENFMGGVGVKRVGFVASGRGGEVAVECMKGWTRGKIKATGVAV